MRTSKELLVLCVLFPVLFTSLLPDRHGSLAMASATNSNGSVCSSIHVGVIVNLVTTTGKRIQASISTAIDEFYKLHEHDHLSTKVVLHFRNSSEDVIGVISTEEKLKSNLSRFAIIIWLFVVLVLTTSYTASFSSMLTVEQLRATPTDVQELIQRGYYVGYQRGSVVANALKRIGFNELKLRKYEHGQYATALSKGTANGGVAAIFDEIPYLKVFMSNHCDDDKYALLGVKPSLSYTIGTGGFGFAFQKNSALSKDVSRSILELKENDEMTKIQMKWFPNSGNSCQEKEEEDDENQRGSSISLRSFGGLFIITGVTSSLMLITHLGIFITLKEWDILKLKLIYRNVKSPWQRACGWMQQHFDKKDDSAFKSHNSSKPMEMDAENIAASASASTELVTRAAVHMPTSPSLSSQQLPTTDQIT